MAKAKNSFVSHAVPLLAFMVASWYGLATVVQNKKDLRTITKGLEPVEELDPVERMRRRYGLKDSAGNAAGQRKEAVPTSSLEEELRKVQQSLDIQEFDYKRVPRTQDEEEHVQVTIARD